MKIIKANSGKICITHFTGNKMIKEKRSEINKITPIMIIAFFSFLVLVYASTFVDNDLGDFNNGTYNLTFYNQTANFTQLTANDTLQELPNNKIDETRDFTAGINMTGNVMLMHLNNGTGENSTYFRDWSENGNNGTCSNCPVFNSSGKLNSAYTFDGTNDFITVPAFSIPDSISVSAWVYSSNFTQNGMIVMKKPVNTQWELFLQNSPGIDGIKWRVLSTETCTTSYPSNNQWHHILATQTGTTCNLYVDGALTISATETAISNGITSGTNDILISTYDGTNFPFNGTIDEVAIWNRSLSASEVTNIYDRQKGEYAGKGEYKSRIFNPGSNSSWNNVSWMSNAIGELSDNKLNEITSNTFVSGNINMTGNVLLMHLNNGSGENATYFRDWSNNNNNGTCSNCPVFNSSGKLSSAFTFDGVNDYIQITDPNAVDVGTGDFTFSTWIKRAKTGDYHMIMTKNAYNDDFEWRVDSDDSLVIWIDGVILDAGNSVDTTWHQVAVTRTSGTVQQYMDGVTAGASSNTLTGSINNARDLYLGIRGSEVSYPFNGTIDEVAIWNRSLSATEISDIYNRTKIDRKLNLSVRSCNDSACSGESFTNVGTLGTVLRSPQTLSVTNNTFFQYKFEFSSNSSYTPELYNVTIGYASTDATAPNITSILYSPNSTGEVDPSANITFTANVSDAENQVSYVTLQYYNGTTWSNSSMSNNTLTNYTISIITVPSQQNYTFNIWANDSLGNSNHSTNQTFNSSWDCTWLSTPDLGSTSGWDTNKFIGNLSINNTGDIAYSNNNCSLDFRLTYDLTEGRIYFDNSYLKPSNTYTITAKANRTIEVNASFLSEIKEEAVVITTQEMFSRSNTSKLNTTVTILSSQSGPYLFQKVTSSPNEISLTAGNFSLEGYLRNLMGGTTVNVTNTAYNVTFNWTLPSGLKNVSGTFKTNFTNITDSELHYNNINVSFSSLASMTSGVKTIYLYAAGVNISGNAIKDSNNNTIIKKEVNITFSCYATADSVCVTACGVDNDPDCTTSSSTSSTGGGGGSGKAGPSTIMGKSSAEYELVRGREQSFELEIQNRYPGVLENLKIYVSGIDKGLIEVFPTEISRIEKGASKFLTIKIIAPAYFTEGSYVLDFSISGSLVSDEKTTPYTERKRVDLFIVDLSRGDANKMRDDSLEMIEQMNNTNMSLKEVLVFYGLLEKSYEERKFSLVKENYESIKEVYDNAYGSLKLIEELYAGIKDAERRGISVLETKKLLFIGEAVFKRGDYSSSIKRLKEAQLTFALETKGEFNLFYAVKNNPLESAGILLGAIFVTFSSFLSIKYKLYRRKLRMLAEEEKLLLELMKVIQRETFEKNHLSMEEYGQAMSQYETKLSGVIEDKIKTETKLAHFFKLKGKQRALKQEKERLYELVKNLQNDYLNKGKIETRTYENMIKVYSTRITEVEEQLIFIEAKEALSGKVKLKK